MTLINKLHLLLKALYLEATLNFFKFAAKHYSISQLFGGCFVFPNSEEKIENVWEVAPISYRARLFQGQKKSRIDVTHSNVSNIYEVMPLDEKMDLLG